MKFAICMGACIPVHAKSLDERPLGGTETAAIRVAEALHAAGHEVFVLTAHVNPPLSEPLYVPRRAAAMLPALDVLIIVREWQALFGGFEAKLRFFWTGDSYDQAHTFGLGDPRVFETLDGVLAVSEWHKQSLCKASGVPLTKVHVLRNGVHLEYFSGHEKRVAKRLIYATTPFRGLKHVPPLYLKIKELHPECQLDIYSGYDVYAHGSALYPAREAEWATMQAQLRQLPDCTLHGNVLQSKLAREYMKSKVFIYPNTFEETSCISALEAQAGGCAIVTSHRGALPETVGEAGAVIPGEPGSADYSTAFVREVDAILRDDSHFQSYSSAGIRQTKQSSWRHITARLEEIVRNVTDTKAAG